MGRKKDDEVPYCLASCVKLLGAREGRGVCQPCQPCQPLSHEKEKEKKRFRCCGVASLASHRKCTAAQTPN